MPVVCFDNLLQQQQFHNCVNEFVFEVGFIAKGVLAAVWHQLRMAHFNLFPAKEKAGKDVRVVAKVVVIFEYVEASHIQYALQFLFSVEAAVGLLLFASYNLLPQRTGKVLKNSNDFPLPLCSQKLAMDCLYSALEGLLGEFDTLEIVQLAHDFALLVIAPNFGYGSAYVGFADFGGHKLLPDWHCLAHFSIITI